MTLNLSFYELFVTGFGPSVSLFNIKSLATASAFCVTIGEDLNTAMSMTVTV